MKRLKQLLNASCAKRLAWETPELTQIGAFGDPGRDPRGWTVSIVFVAIVDPTSVSPQAGDDAAEAAWHPLDQLPPLAFDHDRILAFARQWLASRVCK
jgi:8-oxo-dGTP diphosphatase